MDSDLSHEALARFEALEARVAALESGTKVNNEEEDQEEEEPQEESA